MDKNILNQNLFDRILNNLEVNKESQPTIGEPDEALRKALKIVFMIGLALFVTSIINRMGGYIRYVIPLVIFTYIYLTIIGLNREFGLFVSARSASGSGLKIRSNSFLTFGKDAISSPGKIIPTADSYTVARELGALVMDLQQTGDLAIEKWSQRPATAAELDWYGDDMTEESLDQKRQKIIDSFEREQRIFEKAYEDSVGLLNRSLEAKNLVGINQAQENIKEASEILGDLVEGKHQALTELEASETIAQTGKEEVQKQETAQIHLEKQEETPKNSEQEEYYYGYGL